MFFYRITEGIRVTAQPFYVPEQSDPSEQRYVFVYHIRIENIGREHTAALASLVHSRSGGG